ncbi:TetR family transcriptional regulator [Nocardioides alcanivorans]|uniref:TetR family transcriptional regulator n=1 Tax=Nocardioides alcanivorans TaxID=2897352 RepID=UPI001F44504E|nr:TetR family transcriptional regulator [Nocardioides alcanivorans]
MDRRDVVDKALEVLSVVGLPDLTMRRLGAELGVQQSALYHHFANKQALLGAVADEIVARGPRPSGEGLDDWADLVRERCADLRGAVLAYPDGADVVASMFAFGLGVRSRSGSSWRSWGSRVWPMSSSNPRRAPSCTMSTATRWRSRPMSRLLGWERFPRRHCPRTSGSGWIWWSTGSAHSWLEMRWLTLWSGR